MHMIGSFYLVQKWKVSLALFFASAAYYKYARKGSFLFLEISAQKLPWQPLFKGLTPRAFMGDDAPGQLHHLLIIIGP